MKSNSFQELHAAVSGMLPEPVGKGRIMITPLRKGGNNRLYRVETSGGKYVLKRYFRHPGDSRNRLDTEFTFATFVWRHGIHCIPKPVCRNESAFCALFGLVEGNPLGPGDIDAEKISQAIEFFHNLNALRVHPDALNLANASESCFSLQEHILRVENRLDRLKAIAILDETDKRFLAFVNGPLTSAWNDIRYQIKNSAVFSNDSPLQLCDRVISPSDFGFHNSLWTENRLVFLDFEYAGWDDPTKVVGDFFSQVAVPVPPECFERFATAIASTVSTPKAMLNRVRLLCPLYRIKWCCILLNDFLPVYAGRREFAQGGALERKEEQLDKAQMLLASLEKFMAETVRN